MKHSLPMGDTDLVPALSGTRRAQPKINASVVASVVAAIVCLAWVQAINPIGIVSRAGNQSGQAADASSLVLLLSSVVGLASVALLAVVLIVYFVFGRRTRRYRQSRMRSGAAFGVEQR